MAKNVKCTFLLTQFCRQKTVCRKRAVKYWALTFDTNLMVQFSVEEFGRIGHIQPHQKNTFLVCLQITFG